MRKLTLTMLTYAMLNRPALAQQALPWETPLQTIVDSITGPVAFGISVIAIVSAGAMLVWGGEINEFTRRIVMLTMVISLIVFSTQILSTLFGVSG